MYFDKVTETFGKVPFMRPRQAEYLRDIIVKNELRSLLELGTYHGKSTSFMAAILEDRGGDGHITTMDKTNCMNLSPNVAEMIQELNLEHRVTMDHHERSFTMTLLKLLEKSPRPQFDFCYFDGGHTWDATGFAFFLVDKMLKPGGWIILDDMDWTMHASEQNTPGRVYKGFSEEEKKMRQVRKIWELIVPDLGYINMSEPEGIAWGVAQKQP